MKKVLYISDYILEKNIGAYQLCNSHLHSLKEIVGDKNVDVIALTGKNEYEHDTFECIKAYSNKFEKLKNLIQFNNPFINNDIMYRICKKINENNYYMVFIDNSIFGKLTKKIKNIKPEIKVITFYHDVKKNLCKQWLKEYGIKYLPDYIVNIYNESLNVKYSDVNITLNKRENLMFKKYYKHDSDLQIPIYLKDNLNNIEFSNCDNNSKFNLLFVGAYYYPNIKGIEWLIKNVISKVDENIVLNIVGRGMERLKDELDLQGIEHRLNIIGEVDDLGKCYITADLVVEPIFDGAGMKVKTAEALMYGKNIVGTIEAFEGYTELVDYCDTPKEFIDKINYYYRNRDSIDKFNKTSREAYLKNYSIKSANEKLKEVIFGGNK